MKKFVASNVVQRNSVRCKTMRDDTEAERKERAFNWETRQRFVNPWYQKTTETIAEARTRMEKEDRERPNRWPRISAEEHEEMCERFFNE